MYSNRKYYFFRCYHCGEWHYGNRMIKSRKCWKCNRAFQFKKAIKFTKDCSMNQAITIIKHLKERDEKVPISEYIIKQYNMTQLNKL